MTGVRLLIADRAPTRLGIRMALNGEVDVCAEADDAEQAIRAANREQPNICLVAREICGDGLTAVRGICRAAPNAAWTRRSIRGSARRWRGYAGPICS